MRKSALCVIGLLLTTTAALAQTGARGAGVQGVVPPQTPDESDPRAAKIGDYHAEEYLKPISIEVFDKAVATMFARADTNRDGMITLAELEAVLDARRQEAIRDRFRQIDTNHDGVVSVTEFTVWQQEMGSAAASQCATYAGRIVPDSLGPELHNSDRDDALADVIEPLSALTITRANTHYRVGITLDDLLAYEHKRFNAVDTNHDGFLEQFEIETQRRINQARAAGAGDRDRGR